MGQILLIGLAAGAASALLAAGLSAGSVLAVPLFYLSPLPIMVAGLAFPHWTALLAVVTSSLGLGLVFGGTALLSYILGIGGPAWILAYSALLARPEPAARDGKAWFSLSGLLLLSSALVSVSVSIALLSLASDYSAYRDAIETALKIILEAGAGAPTLDLERIAAVFAAVLPPGFAAVVMISLVGCLYLAARVARISGRLTRPWPVLSAVRLPPVVALAFLILTTIAFRGGMAGLLASVCAAALLIAFCACGLAVLHALTLGRAGRGLILTAVWMASVVLVWPALIAATIGLVDSVLDLRTRMGTNGGPPAANDR